MEKQKKENEETKKKHVLGEIPKVNKIERFILYSRTFNQSTRRRSI